MTARLWIGSWREPVLGVNLQLAKLVCDCQARPRLGNARIEGHGVGVLHFAGLLPGHPVPFANGLGPPLLLAGCGNLQFAFKEWIMSLAALGEAGL